MSLWWSSASIRVRLTAWYTAVLALLLVVYATATFVAVRHEFRESLELESDAGTHGQVEPSPEARVDEQLREILVVLVLGLPVIVVLAGVGGYLLARRALAPIEHLAAETRRITADRLHERLSVPNQYDEIGRLAAVINDMFARLESSFGQLRRFTADASHELRTPLSLIRGIGELGLGETRSPSEYKEAMGSMLEEVDRLTHLVDTLLRLSRGDAGTVRLSREVVDLGDMARDVTVSLNVLAEERRQRLHLTSADGVRVSADRLVLRTPSRTSSTTRSNAGRRFHDRRACKSQRSVGDPYRRRPGPGIHHSIAHASSIGSIASMRVARAEMGGSGWARDRKWAVKQTAEKLRSTRRQRFVFRISLPRLANT